MRLVMIPKYTIDPLRHNEELGVDYLLGKMTEKDFAIALQRGDKNMQKSREILNVLTMVMNTSTDIVYRFSEHLRTTNSMSQKIASVSNEQFAIIDEIRELFKYANDCFARISKNYNSKSSLVIGNELETQYWVDNGTYIHLQMHNNRPWNYTPNPLWYQENIAPLMK